MHLQLAVLYTTPFTRKRIVRVHNLTLISSSRPSVIFRNVDLEAVTCALLRQALLKAMTRPLILPNSTASSGEDSDWCFYHLIYEYCS